MLSNLDLIQTFVQQSCLGEEVLLSNSELKAERVCNTNQLIAKKGGVILTTRTITPPIEFSAQLNSPYWQLVAQALVSNGFLISGELNQNNFYSFHHYKIPKGYETHCTEAKMLWRAWWRHRQQILRSAIPMELFIRVRNNWYPVRDLSICENILLIKTFGHESHLDIQDLVIWLSKYKSVPQVA